MYSLAYGCTLVQVDDICQAEVCMQQHKCLHLNVFVCVLKVPHAHWQQRVALLQVHMSTLHRGMSCQQHAGSLSHGQIHVHRDANSMDVYECSKPALSTWKNGWAVPLLNFLPV